MEDSAVLEGCSRLRRDLADWLETLSADQLATASLCGGWTVQDVAGHLTAVLTLSHRALLAETVRGGFRLHRANAELARRESRRGVGHLAGALRRHADVPLAPPGVGIRGPLADLLVHVGDMRVPLGLPMPDEPDLGCVALDFLTTKAPGFVPRSRLAGIRLVATDADRSWRTGAEVSGTIVDLMMAACGRPAVLGRLTGSGVPMLAARI